MADISGLNRPPARVKCWSKTGQKLVNMSESGDRVGGGRFDHYLKLVKYWSNTGQSRSGDRVGGGWAGADHVRRGRSKNAGQTVVKRRSSGGQTAVKRRSSGGQTAVKRRSNGGQTAVKRRSSGRRTGHLPEPRRQPAAGRGPAQPGVHVRDGGGASGAPEPAEHGEARVGGVVPHHVKPGGLTSI
jgi:hypothetical protein